MSELSQPILHWWNVTEQVKISVCDHDSLSHHQTHSDFMPSDTEGFESLTMCVVEICLHLISTFWRPLKFFALQFILNVFLWILFARCLPPPSPDFFFLSMYMIVGPCGICFTVSLMCEITHKQYYLKNLFRYNPTILLIAYVSLEHFKSIFAAF